MEDINLLAMDVYDEQNKELTEYYIGLEDVDRKKLVPYNKRVMIKPIQEVKEFNRRKNE